MSDSVPNAKNIKELSSFLSGEANVIEISDMPHATCHNYVRVVRMPCENETLSNVPYTLSESQNISMSAVPHSSYIKNLKVVSSIPYEEENRDVSNFRNSLRYSKSDESNLNMNMMPHITSHEKQVVSTMSYSTPNEQNTEISNANVISGVSYSTFDRQNLEISHIPHQIYHEENGESYSTINEKNWEVNATPTVTTHQKNVISNVPACTGKTLEISNLPHQIYHEENGESYSTINEKIWKVNATPTVTTHQKNVISNVPSSTGNTLEISYLPHQIYHQENGESYSTINGKNWEMNATPSVTTHQKNVISNVPSCTEQTLEMSYVPNPIHQEENFVPYSKSLVKNIEIDNISHLISGENIKIKNSGSDRDSQDNSVKLVAQKVTMETNLHLNESQQNVINYVINSNYHEGVEKINKTLENLNVVDSQLFINHEKKNHMQNPISQNINRVSHSNTDEENKATSVVEHSIPNEFIRLYFQERSICLSEDFRKLFPDAVVLEGSTLSLTISGKKARVTLVCFLCSVTDYCRFSLEKKPHEIRFVIVNGQYYLICQFCRHLLDWNCQTLFNDTIYLKQISYFCKWKCDNNLTVDKLYDHEKKCDKQLLQECPIKSCEHRLKFFELSTHLKIFHPEFRPPYGYLIYMFYGGTLVKLKCSMSPFELIFVQSNIPVFVKFIWEEPFWRIILSCKIPNLKLRSVIIDKQFNLIAFIKETGVIPHFEQIHLKCYFADIKRDEFEEKIRYEPFL